MFHETEKVVKPMDENIKIHCLPRKTASNMHAKQIFIRKEMLQNIQVKLLVEISQYIYIYICLVAI